MFKFTAAVTTRPEVERRRDRGHRRRAALAALVATAAAALPALAGGGSYHKVDSEADVARFYSSRGEAFVGRSVHVHVPRTVFRKEIAPEKRRTESRNREFADRGVPLLVSPSNPYFQQFLRKKASGGQACVKGRVERRPGVGGAPVAVLFVETVGTAGDSHVKAKGGKKGKKKKNAGGGAR